ncbi:hypothetical protein F7D13_16230 [Methylocystis rosea]|uniref:Type II toxin-antitoxin system RelE/ParE family toxin n=1 Tax=Methylocystis rosea TaxID=173366 RepID=A0ABX6ENK2_9HYPH|nr:hypothetical protein [Methylocystis rosea]QGM95460.1 hypothetical protein F7D13_16230 [Methylocystis rosea]
MTKPRRFIERSDSEEYLHKAAWSVVKRQLRRAETERRGARGNARRCRGGLYKIERALTPTPYALPLRIRKAAESFVVEDAGGLALVYVYFKEDPSRQRLVNRLSGADAKE